MKMTPDRVLEECGIHDRPIPLERIIEHFQFEQVVLDASGDISGAILQENGKVYIAVNPSQHPNRQRFTIAHELGHYFCNEDEDIEHVDTDFRVNWRDATSSAGEDWKEVQANGFAAELLMPWKLLRKDLEKFTELDIGAVQRLASLYKVSRLAMQYRLINLGLLLPPDENLSSAV